MKNIYLLIIALLFLCSSEYLTAQAFLNANGPGNTFEDITNVLAPGMDTSAVEDPQCIHPSYGRHVAELWDTDQAKYVYEFYMHVAVDNDRCINFDRQRVEIKTYESSSDNLKGVTGETILYKWRFKVPVGFKPSSSFTHIHQIKAVGGDDDDPLITLTVRKGSPNKMELIHNNTTKVSIVNLSLFEGSWVECTEAIKVDSLAGTYSMVIKKVSDGTTIMSYSSASLMTIRYNNTFIRPKWGIYRSLNSPADLRDDSIRFSDFYIGESATTVLPAAPSGLNVTAASATQLNLSWTDNSSNEEWFYIERSPDGSSWAVIDTVDPNSTAFSNTGLSGGTTYYYRIRSANTFGTSAYSNSASTATPATPVKYTSTGNTTLWSTQVWSPAGTPGAIDTIVIAHDITLDADVTVGQMTVNSGITLTVSATRTIGGNLVVNGTFLITSSSVTATATGNVTVTGTSALLNISSSTNKLQGSSGKTFTLSNGATAKFAVAATVSPSSMVPTFTWSVDNSVNTTTISMAAGASNVTIGDLPNAQLYGNLILTTSTSGGTGPTYTFSAARTINGSLTYQSLGRILTVNQSAVITSNGTNATVSSTAATQSVVVNISAAGIPYTGFTGCTLTGTSGVTVTYNGTAAQTLLGGQYANLTVNNAAGVSLGGNTTVSGTLTLTNGLLTLGSNNLLLGAASVISGTPTASNMIVATGTGEAQKTFTAAGSFTYPIGDNTGTAEYSPVTLTVNSAGAFSSAYVGAKVTDAKHPSNASTANFLTRYWTLSASGITSPNYSVTFSYLTSDVNGTESSIYGGRYNGSWVLLSPVNDAANTFTGSSLTAFSDFTGGESNVLPVELVSFSAKAERVAVRLTWTTATEVNNHGFEVERAPAVQPGDVRGLQWTTLGAVTGHGTTNAPQEYSYIDPFVTGNVFYRLKQIDRDGNVSYTTELKVLAEALPNTVMLHQNYPNPFNPATTIEFSVPVSSYVRLSVYTLLGQEVDLLVNGTKEAGMYAVPFDASGYSSGVYLYRLQAGQYSTMKKMTVTK
jgi:hypothetical protein